MNQSRISQIAAGSPATPEEARELAGMCQWRPMSEAPMDGTEVLAWWHVADVAIYDGSNWLGSEGRVVYPTHWLPLPAAPEVGK